MKDPGALTFPLINLSFPLKYFPRHLVVVFVVCLRASLSPRCTRNLQSAYQKSSLPASTSPRKILRPSTAKSASEISLHHLPGAVVLVARNGGVVWRKPYGDRAVEPKPEAMTVDTIFDVASLTKVVATATSIMILVERGKVRLSDPLSTYIPEIKGDGRERITIELLLTHRAGYAPDFDLKERWSGYDEAVKRLVREPLRNPPGAKFVYSDINYIALGEVVHRASGLTLDEFARRNIFVPLGMLDTGFRPHASLRERIAPTESAAGN